MISALTSYIWGDEETTESAETNPEESSVVAEGETISPEDAVTITDVSNEDVDNEWIFIRPNKQETPKRRRNRSEAGDDTASESADSVASSEQGSWCVEPPSCFRDKTNSQQLQEMGSLENLLIEHPSMSIYQSRIEQRSEGNTVADTRAPSTAVTHHAQAGRMAPVQKKQRAPLKDLALKANAEKKRSGNVAWNSMKRTNQTTQLQSKSPATRNKSCTRMAGKHARSGAMPSTRHF